MTEEIKKRVEMIKNGEVPPEYENIYGYIIPFEWKERICKLNTKFNRLTRKNTSSNSNVLTISAQRGLINQEDYYKQYVASEEKSNYYILKKGDFAYNKSYSSGYDYGAIKRLEKYDCGVVSPLYICFETKDDTVSDYYLHYFEAGIFNHEIYKIAQEGARNHGLLNVAVGDFFNGVLINPPKIEQKKIAEILTTCDKVIELKEKLITEKKQQKKWLMQNLLNPDSGVRLDGFSGEWKDKKLFNLCKYRSSSISATSIEKFDGNELYPIYNANSIEKMIDTYDMEKDYISIIKDGAGVGRVVFCKGKSSVIGTMGYIIPMPGYSLKYIYYSISLVKFKRYTTGSTIPHVYFRDYKKEKIKIPPSLEEQTAITNIISFADDEINLLQDELKAWELKKKSLMQLLLTGVVRVKV